VARLNFSVFTSRPTFLLACNRASCVFLCGIFMFFTQHMEVMNFTWDLTLWVLPEEGGRSLVGYLLTLCELSELFGDDNVCDRWRIMNYLRQWMQGKEAIQEHVVWYGAGRYKFPGDYLNLSVRVKHGRRGMVFEYGTWQNQLGIRRTMTVIRGARLYMSTSFVNQMLDHPSWVRKGFWRMMSSFCQICLWYSTKV